MNRTHAPAATCPNPEHRALLTTACQTALAAGQLIRERYTKPHSITMKGVINLVTETDLASEALILTALHQATPDIPVLAEESALVGQTLATGRTWVVDPLDGTTNFAHGFPYFAVSIALLEHDQPLVAALYDPMADELFCAAQGSGAWLNGHPLRVTPTSQPIEALIGTGFPYDIEANLEAVLGWLRRLLPRVRDIRRAGAAALDLAYVACGRLDGFYEINLQPWDTAAGWLLVTEAGGQVTDLTGAPYSVFLPRILATNSCLHPALLTLLA